MEVIETDISEEMYDRDTPYNEMDQYNFSSPLLYSAPRSSEAGYSYIQGVVLRLIRPLQTELTETKERLSDVEKDNEILKERIVRMEGFNRRYNLKFNGIREVKNENKQDCKRVIRNILFQSGLNIPHKAIESATRIGQKSTEAHKPRSILVKLFHLEDKEYIQLKSQQIKNSCRVWIEEDFPLEIESKRRVLKTVLMAANKISQDGQKKYNAKLNVDKLSINGKTYTTSTTHKLPEELKLYNITTPTNGSQTAFFSYHSPLSNHYKARQVVDKKVYNCNEQYYMHAKALRFSDHQSAQQILKENDPVIQKKIGSNIEGFNEDRWRESCQDIMKRGLQAKFGQNQELEEFLLETENNNLLEGNPRDTYWGTGLSIYDRKIWQSSSWVGKAENNLGKLLEEVRRELRRKKKSS